MRRLLLAVIIVRFFGLPSVSAAEPVALRPAQRKMAIEWKLDSPLGWELKDRDHVTLAELIEFVRNEHDLHVRWDVGTLGLIFGKQAPLAELIPAALAQQDSQGATCPTEGRATCSVTLQQPYDNLYDRAGQTQLQTPGLHDGASKPIVAGTPLVAGGYATAYAGQATPTQADVSQPAAPAPTESPSYESAPHDLPLQQIVPPEGNNPTLAYPPYTAPNSPPIVLPDSDDSAANGPEAIMVKYLTTPISLSSVSLGRATIREALGQLLDAASVHTAAIPFAIGLPLTTRAMNLDLLVDENSVLITTQLRANATKETRVYRLGSLSELPSETLVRVITHSVRPWSWRNQANEIAQQLASRWPATTIPLPKVELSATEGITLSPIDGHVDGSLSASAMPNVSGETIAATGQLVAGGAVAAVYSIVAALEIVHYGDPPTGVIESLPGLLIITQSQAAHREIKELLDELSEE